MHGRLFGNGENNFYLYCQLVRFLIYEFGSFPFLHPRQSLISFVMRLTYCLFSCKSFSSLFSKGHTITFTVSIIYTKAMQLFLENTFQVVPESSVAFFHGVAFTFNALLYNIIQYNYIVARRALSLTFVSLNWNMLAVFHRVSGTISVINK